MKEILGNFKFLAIETVNQIKLTHGLLTNYNLEVLEKIESKDDYIDNLKTTIENACFARIATLNSVTDKETINRIRAVHIICINLERIADFCVNITRQIQYLSSHDFIKDYDSQEMFGIIQESITNVIQVFSQNDLTGALHICKAEFELDRLWAQTFKTLLGDLKEGKLATDIITVIFIFRYLERIGDSILNIGEALIFGIKGDRIKIRQFEALEKTLKSSGFEGSLDDINFASIWGSRSGCRISKVSRKNPSGFKSQGIFKEGKIKKIKTEHENICYWEKVFPGLAPKVFGYYEKSESASMLVQFLPGCTLDQIILTEDPDVLGNVVFILENTITEIWHNTKESDFFPTNYMGQLNERIEAVQRVHPEFLRSELIINSFSVLSTGELIKRCMEIEKNLPAPFSVFIHGDFNTNNIVYSHEEQKINYIDLYRSKKFDYVQDASVFLTSNFRMPVFETELRERLNRANMHFYGIFKNFAQKNNDTTFQVRMALALARSFLTSTRFELKPEFAAEMSNRAHFLMERILRHRDTPWEKFHLPESIIIY